MITMIPERVANMAWIEDTSLEEIGKREKEKVTYFLLL